MQDTLTEKTYQELRRRLLRGDLRPGDQLVNRTLAKDMGVSLAPLREAINRLATEGLVQQVPGAGAFVRKLTRQDLHELYVLREAVETFAAAEAARAITPGQLEELEALGVIGDEITEQIRRQKKQIATEALFDRWLDYEERFHTTIVEAARNAMLKKVVVEHRALSRIFEAQRLRTTILTLVVAEKTIRDHAALVKALRKQDAELARQLMGAHIRQGRQTVLEHFRNMQQI